MEVNDPDLGAFESATCAQLQAGELGEIEALIPNLQPNTSFRTPPSEIAVIALASQHKTPGKSGSTFSSIKPVAGHRDCHCVTDSGTSCFGAGRPTSPTWQALQES